MQWVASMSPAYRCGSRGSSTSPLCTMVSRPPTKLASSAPDKSIARVSLSHGDHIMLHATDPCILQLYPPRLPEMLLVVVHIGLLQSGT